MYLNISERFKNMAGRYPMLILLSSLFLLTIVPEVRAQDGTVILPTREVSVRQALEEIELQAGYNIGISWEKLDPDMKVMMPAGSLSVKELLAHTFAGTGHTWKVTGRQISVIHRPSEEERGARSTMHRNSISPSQMVPVPDAWSKNSRTMSAEELEASRSAYWDNGGITDSIALAVINFRVNKTSLERDYMDNKQTLDLIHRTFVNKETLAAMDFIVVTAAASPEGNTAANRKLAADRAMAVKSYLMWRYPFLNRDMIHTFSIGEDWSGLRKMVEEDTATPYRQEILGVIDSGSDSDTKRSRLKALGGGRAYRYLADNMLPHLRGAAACMIYYKQEPQPVIIERHTHTTDTVYIETIVEREMPLQAEVPLHEQPAQPLNPRYYAVKTNLLYDAVLLPDLAFEFSLGRRWSVEIGGQWSWWNTKAPKHYYHRIQMAGIELRKWLGHRDRTPLTGHFIGLYGMGGTYDIKFGNKGSLSDWSYSCGLTYGYATPVGRRLNLEFSLGIGYLGGEYKKYTYYGPHDCYPWEGTFNRNYIGLTKADISLVWLIGSGVNSDKKKKK